MHDDKPEEHGWVGVRARFTRREPGPHTLKWIMVPLIGFVIAANVGDAFMPTLVDSNPLLLAALNSRTRNLVLVTNQLDALEFYAVSFLRLLASDPLFYLLGWYYGDRAVEWIETKHDGAGRFMRGAEQFFSKAAYPLVFIAPNNIICLLAGSAAMPIGIFILLNATGTIARLYLIRVFGEAFDQPIEAVLGFIADYRPYLLALTIGIVLVTSARQTRSGTGELGELLHLEEELDLKDRAANPDPRSDRGDPPPS